MCTDVAVVPSVHYGAYAIVGASRGQLRAALDALGPVRGGRRFGAFTDWHIAWRYRHRGGVDGPYEIVEAAVEVSALITVPRWIQPRSTAPGLLNDWQTFLAGVELHERGHVAIASAAGEEVRRRLLELPAFDTRTELEEAAAAAARIAIREGHAREMAYDVATRHGETQGASFAGTMSRSGRSP